MRRKRLNYEDEKLLSLRLAARSCLGIGRSQTCLRDGIEGNEPHVGLLPDESVITLMKESIRCCTAFLQQYVCAPV